MSTLSKSSDKNLESVLHLIDKKELVSLVSELVRIESVNPPGQEDQASKFLSSKMQEIGLEIEIQEISKDRSNVYGTLRGTKNSPILVLSGHTDVVPAGEGWKHNPFEATIESNRIYGRGAVDMKGALGAMVMAAKALKDSNLKLNGSLMIVGLAGEEVDSIGARRMVERGLKADYAVIGEPTKLKVCIAQKGTVTHRIVTRGKASHSSVPEKGINAILKMTEVIEALELHGRKISERRHRLLGHPTLNIGVVEGGVTPWIVPETCKIAIDRRIIPGENTDTVEKELNEIVEELKKRDPELVVEISPYSIEYNAMEISEDQPVVKAFRQASTNIIGVDHGVHGGPTCDAQFFVNKLKIPTVIFGPGDLGQAHKPDEFVPIDDILQCAKIYAAAAIQLLS